jgi:hypothetical protein
MIGRSGGMMNEWLGRWEMRKTKRPAEAEKGRPERLGHFELLFTTSARSSAVRRQLRCRKTLGLRETREQTRQYLTSKRRSYSIRNAVQLVKLQSFQSLPSSSRLHKAKQSRIMADLDTTTSSSSTSLEDSQLSTNISTTNSSIIRSSRRRLKKGVVLNTDRIQKYITSSSSTTNSISILTSDEQEIELSNNSMHISMLSVSNNDVTSNTSNSNTIATAADTTEEELSFTSSQKIQKWWRSQSQRKYTQYEKWSLRQADLVFGLILGRRVRNIIQSPEAKRTIFALGDIYKVLKGIITTAELIGGGTSKSLSDSTSSLDLMAQVRERGKEK